MYSSLMSYDLHSFIHFFFIPRFFALFFGECFHFLFNIINPKHNLYRCGLYMHLAIDSVLQSSGIV